MRLRMKGGNSKSGGDSFLLRRSAPAAYASIQQVVTRMESPQVDEAGA